MERGKKWEEIENKDHVWYERRVRGVSFERKCDEEIARGRKGKSDRGNREGEINQPVIIY